MLLVSLCGCEVHTSCPESAPGNGDKCQGEFTCEYGYGVSCCGQSYSAFEITCTCVAGSFSCINHREVCKGAPCDAAVDVGVEAGPEAGSDVGPKPSIDVGP